MCSCTVYVTCTNMCTHAHTYIHTYSHVYSTKEWLREWTLQPMLFGCSVTQLCPALCDPMECSTPGFPVHHHLLEFAPTHLHWVSDAIQPSLRLWSPSPLPLNFPSIRVFSNEVAFCIRWPKYWSFSFSISPSNECSGLISLRIDSFDLLVVQGTLKSLL